MYQYCVSPFWAENARLERGDVGGDVGEFRHCYQVAANEMASATNFFRWLRGRIALSISRVAPLHAAGAAHIATVKLGGLVRSSGTGW